MGDVDVHGQTVPPISAVLADVDGTLVTKEKVLTEQHDRRPSSDFASAASSSPSAAAGRPGRCRGSSNRSG